ncbi:MAG: hypothetical protein M1823_001771 [Watsoniomyces obsoletus]|nr:MAG: hypothetical protein M1823_001771 [Watsoniomyces obsoletus]
MASKNEVFQKLKPYCVDVSQKALSLGRSQTGPKDLSQSLERLLKILQSVASSSSSSSFDEKLAEYVFFPLSHVLRQSNAIPQRALELALHCLHVLLSTGWKATIPKDLGIQLLILLTLTAAGGASPSGKMGVEVSEELQLIAFRCLSSLFHAFNGSPDIVATLRAPAHLPALAHAVTVMLDEVKNGSSSAVQLVSISALDALQECIQDMEIMASFFPGIVSGLTRALQRDTHSKRNWRVMEASLRLFEKTIRGMMDDEQITTYFKTQKSPAKSSGPTVPLTEFWVKIAAEQVKIALSTVIKLQDHDRYEVQQALLALCQTLLERCQQSLADCATLMVETIVGLSSTEAGISSTDSQSVLSHMATEGSPLPDILKSSIYAWITALPRVVHSNDDKAKKKIIHQISSSVRLLSDIGAEPNLINDMLVTSLRDSVSTVIAPSAARIDVMPLEDNSITTKGLSGTLHKATSYSFSSIMTAQKSQKEVLSQLGSLVAQISASSSGAAITGELVDTLPRTAGDGAVASFWISLNLTRNALQLSGLADINPIQTCTALSWSNALEELYAYSLSKVLTTWKDDSDWRLQCLALETIALQAQILGDEFRTELVEALYPVVHLVGSSNPRLQQHAMTSLNIIAQECGYSNAGDLLIKNVDYLVNAVALKLNTFDLSPQAPQVLLMMIKLAGPSLLPYLDDLVGSIFAALDNFHGYPRLVELLFAVLREIVTEGSKSSGLRNTSKGEINHRKTPYQPRKMSEVATLLAENAKRRAARKAAEDELLASEKVPFPQAPWKDVSHFKNGEDSNGTKVHELEDNNEVAEEENADDQPPPPESKPPPPSRTYTMLLSIARLSQHYLTHESPRLRRDLLQVIRTASIALQHNEDLFLPLVNDIWPVVIKRIYDHEAYVAVAATEAVSGICLAAGDFMTTRIETEWGNIKKLYWRVYPTSLGNPSSSSINKPKGLKGKTTRTGTSTRDISLRVRTSDSTPTMTISKPNNANIISQIAPNQDQGSTREASPALLTISKTTRTNTTNNPPNNSNRSPWETKEIMKTERFTPSNLIFESLLELFKTIVEYVHISEDIFDDILDMVKGVLVLNSSNSTRGVDDLRRCLEERNENAVWLVMNLGMNLGKDSSIGGVGNGGSGKNGGENEGAGIREGDTKRRPKTPVMEGYTFRPLPF